MQNRLALILAPTPTQTPPEHPPFPGVIDLANNALHPRSQDEFLIIRRTDLETFLARITILSGPTHGISPEILRIQAAVADHFGVSLNQILEATRGAERVSFARQVAIYLTCQLTSLSTYEIATAFRRRDHSTVLFACRRVQDRIDTEPSVAGAILHLRQTLTA